MGRALDVGGIRRGHRQGRSGGRDASTTFLAAAWRADPTGGLPAPVRRRRRWPAFSGRDGHTAAERAHHAGVELASSQSSTVVDFTHDNIPAGARYSVHRTATGTTAPRDRSA